MGSITPTFTAIPILDYARSTSPDTKPRFLAELRHALVHVGFFYLVNAPIAPHVRQTFVDQSLALFDLPLEKKLEIEMVHSKHFLGYSRLGAETTASKADYREQFDFATELPPPGPEEPLYRNIRGPNQWPDESSIPGFRRAIEAYLAEIGPLADAFRTLIAEALDLPPTALHPFFDVPQQHKLKLIKYPAPRTAADAQGVGAHKDSEFLTFLLQATPHAGLEVQNKAGDWIAAPPVPGSLVVNIGRALEAVTRGVCTATTHRVSLRPENFVDALGRARGPRFSFPVFQGMSLELCAEDIRLDIPRHIRDLVRDEQVRSDAEPTFNKVFNGKTGEGTLLHRITSHQDVGRRWYPELLDWALKERGGRQGGAAA
ncbi:isopenicillin N synthase family dioxygenase [Aspergillus clavatus NRRL 1]|uniref:Oxidoreductase, 2OG-Fe(II) oxygenase family, putative n=1 Tax=Aspergillus clavatus (strain ATCC 1007 / CBS 513.65 / DSM 816 / NCTC 3887 / NRRL 1 / QM 1276 / 107) TaxID=344612 RepID=A1CLH3_ASPCL|nr:oxidoreductase, 2OG-Fe(II) oxygenase family, putative [Aspergillus clavatus NRRL 1]EAW09997.1 oxidoreductase, 2OG-Fe(II) oxygenase family, putative [Aspergillus clavatus NRRL 1]